MTSPIDLAREYTGLDLGARNHLERFMAVWGMLADLSFSDLLLYVPIDQFSLAVAEPGVDSWDGGPPQEQGGSLTGLHFVVLGQMRPTTSQTLFELDLLGQVVAAAELPLVLESWRRGTIMTGERPAGAEEGPVLYQCIPVRWRGDVVAVLSRVWSPSVGRRTGGLERVYLRLFDRLATMVASGLYPFVTDEDAAEEAPRVGDGVVVLDAEQRVTFASPNAVNALHRMGLVSAIVGSTLASLGVDSDAVSEAFERRVPVIEEIERRPDVMVLVRCIPLIQDGEVTGAAVLVRDVTDLRRRDRLLLSKDATIREVHHRVKNNLQTISSLLRLQSRRLEDRTARVALLEAERRIRAIALVHEILAREPGEQVPFNEIVPALVQLAKDANMTAAHVQVEVSGDAGDLVADVATPLAVVIAELLQNAVEHAFVGEVHEPRVELSLANDSRTLEVEIRDNGQGFPDGFDIDRTRSLGLAIVRDLVRSQLGGSIEIESGGGAVVRLTVPLDRPGAMPDE
ncbi:MAG TPA: PAS domain-containing sensor histidine kinase [Acidimicrobiales bacterium]|nr:PAS domain-containing sensor histidine kinase [Acidimicrobiales bacterium]